MGNLLIGFTIAFLSSREGHEIAKKVAKKVLENLSEKPKKKDGEDNA